MDKNCQNCADLEFKLKIKMRALEQALEYIQDLEAEVDRLDLETGYIGNDVWL